MNNKNHAGMAARAAIGGLCAVCLTLAFAAVAWNKPASANAFAQQATGYDCAVCHVNVSANVTRAGLTPFGTQWQDNSCPTKSGNLCAPK
ncbi:MAG: hypothetical protein IPK81_24775 [Rhodospirillales bacterium]|nr:MAG: hypothetical protein IPK81_24775 [Rhodospirillales bacterium]